MAREIDYRCAMARLIATVEGEADNFASELGTDKVHSARIARLRKAAAEASGFLRAADLPPFEEVA